MRRYLPQINFTSGILRLGCNHLINKSVKLSRSSLLIEKTAPRELQPELGSGLEVNRVKADVLSGVYVFVRIVDQQTLRCLVTDFLQEQVENPGFGFDEFYFPRDHHVIEQIEEGIFSAGERESFCGPVTEAVKREPLLLELFQYFDHFRDFANNRILPVLVIGMDETAVLRVLI